MVMITRSAYRRATESLNSSNSNSDISKKNILRIPPWCSSGKAYERRKPRRSVPAWDTRSSYTLRDNVWDYLNTTNRLDDSRRFQVKKQQNRTNNRRAGKIFACFFTVLGLTVTFLVPNGTPKIELLKSILPDVKLLSFGNSKTIPAGEDCCYQLRQLTVTLSRIERELRNMLRLRRKFMLSLPNTRTKSTNGQNFSNEIVIQGTRAVKGSNTREWGTQVALWGVFPLWSTAPSPDTILALREPKPSDCWPFDGSYGEVIIELPRKMHVSSLSLEHIQPDTAKSAPKDFIIYAIQENGSYVKTAEGSYTYKDAAKQYYLLNNENSFTKYIVFRVLSNQGNPKYTCIYRVQVYYHSKYNHVI